MMSRLGCRALLVAAATLTLSFAAASPAPAQTSSAKPPQPSRIPTGKPFLTSAVGVLLGAAVIGAAGFKSKRGHQD